MRFCLVALLLSSVCQLSSIAQADEPKDNPERWAKAMAAFEQKDKENAPPQNAILFVGSSSIRMWDVKKSFPDRLTINRGFGGSEISDSIHYIDTLVIKHKPRVVLLYAGDNDMSRGKSADRVVADFKKFRAALHKKLPKTRLLFIAIKPSIKRWNLYPKMKVANLAIKKICEGDELLGYVDIATPMLDDSGKPLENLFAKDGLHLNEAGYTVWNKQVRDALRKK